MNFQTLLIKMLIEEHGFFKKHRSIISRYKFDNNYSNFLLECIREHYSQYNTTPSYDILRMIIDQQVVGDSMAGKVILDHLDQIQMIRWNEGEQEYIKKNIKGKLQKYLIEQTADRVEKMDHASLLQVIKEIENLKQDSFEYEIKHLWELENDHHRIPVETGIDLIDDNGGVAKGEIAILLASTGIGKSVFLTHIASELMLRNNKVLHIVFEGALNDYIGLHRRKLGNYTNDQIKTGKTTSNLKVVKMSSGKTSLNDVSNLIEYLGSDFIPDVVVIDYIDVIAPSTSKKENWQSEIITSTELEDFCIKHNVVCWTAVQTNRSGLNENIPTLNQMGGSVSKGQKASMVLGVSRTSIHQKENKADIAILKNRHGSTGELLGVEWNPTTMKLDLNPKKVFI